ncbi:hypothetical protein [Anaeromyxobacter paludicola]|uniref:Lipoprotein n=1 Tax=Anaeromyxobacter paludicola TaxID=2918171 RepID=A0ABN6NAN4_9BACT|nr:hypothetical protein [Anaeromyxobacter paludicola]BDG09007.1 hypothetical protein AMPC_21200 [Anaeromyxobacter paludicola]
MKTTALLAASLVVLAGCSSSASYGDVTFYWNFRDASGTQHGDFGRTNTGCSDAVVDEVDVTFAGHVFQVQDASGNPSCEAGSQRVPGITVSNFRAGTYDFTIRGYRSGALVYEQTGTIGVHGGPDNSRDVTLDALSPQSIPIYYTLDGVQRCVAADGTPITGINYAIYDANNVQVDATAATGVACDPNSFGLLTRDLPLGNYTLGHLQAVTLVGGAPQSVYEVCEQPLSHLGVALDFNLLPSASGCVR